MIFDERFMPLSDVALALDVSVRDVVDLIDSGELPGIIVGGHQRVTHDALEAFIADRHEQQRRAALWNQSQTASVIDLFGPRKNQQ